MPPSPAAPLSCSECGAPIATTADLQNTLSDEELAALPSHLLSRARVLCPACAHPGVAVADTDTSQPAMSEGSRYFRLVLSLQESMSPPPIAPGPEPEWENVGGFILRGHNESVRGFVESQADEFGKRMQVILDFADEGG